MLTMSQPFRKGRQRGATMIELVFFLVGALTVVVGAIVLYRTVQLSQNTNELTRSVVSVQTGVRGLYQSSRDFGSADITGTLIAAGGAPGNLVGDADGDGSDDELIHAWGGEMIITGAGPGFFVDVESVPAEACTRMISFGPSGQGMAGTGIDGVAVAATLSGLGGTTLETDEITPADAATACDVNNGDPVSIRWALSR